ncbi:MAG TPA: hypothetical protein VJL29_12585, partial [Thermoguttaceae bacterium]|nr:hypothetical protein [Thermoguttaceae bacterium]
MRNRFTLGFLLVAGPLGAVILWSAPAVGDAFSGLEGKDAAATGATDGMPSGINSPSTYMGPSPVASPP